MRGRRGTVEGTAAPVRGPVPPPESQAGGCRRRGGGSGFTLVETMIVVAIFGLLLLILGGSFQGWMAKYKVEDDTKRIYAALTAARAQAMQKSRSHFVAIDNTTFRRCRTYDDSAPGPDGDGTLTVGSDAMRDDVSTTYTITPALTGGVNQFRFGRDGIPTATGTIRLVSTLSPEYDCITIRETRINMGAMSGGVCQEK